MTTTYVCTECNKTYSTEIDAAHCHWGVGGVERRVNDVSVVGVAIDTVTGAWGDANNLLFVRNVTPEQINDLAEMADSDIIQWAYDHGSPIVNAEYGCLDCDFETNSETAMNDHINEAHNQGYGSGAES